MTPADTLRAARKLIQKERNWGQGGLKVRLRTSWLRRLFHGYEYRYCAVGALREVVGHGQGKAREILDRAAIRVNTAGYTNALSLNDYTDYSTVLQMFDLAIKMAEAQG